MTINMKIVMKIIIKIDMKKNWYFFRRSFDFMIGVNTFIFWYKLNQSSGFFFNHLNDYQSTANILQRLCRFLVYPFDNLYLIN